MITQKPTIPDVLPLIQDYLEDNIAGGNLHIVLDDGNYTDSAIRLCLDCAKAEHDERGIVIAEMLLMMSKTQWRKLRSLI